LTKESESVIIYGRPKTTATKKVVKRRSGP